MNKKILYIKHFLLLLVGLVVATSCEDILEEDPKGLLSQKNFWNNDANAIGAVNAVYSYPLERGNREHTWNFWFEGAAHDFIHWDVNFRTGIINGTWDASSFHFWDCWRNSYAPISRANFVLSNLETATISDNVSLRVEGEARFLRALHYFNLVRAFGDIPLILKQSESDDDFLVEKSPSDVVYEAILMDLNIAIERLPLKSAYGPQDIGRASKGAAQSLLAKVYLTLGGFQKVVDLTEEVVNSGEYGLQPNFADIFESENDNGQEWIFSYQSLGEAPQNNHIMGAWTFPSELNGIDGFSRGFGNLFLSDEMVNLYNTNDTRFNDMVWNNYVTESGDTIDFVKGSGYMSKKYYDTDFSKNLLFTKINYPILRYSDVLLMNAEAINEISPLSGEAFAKLNMVRNRAGLADLTAIDIPSKESLLNEILDERRREFVNENQRFWDLKRRNLFLEVSRQKPYARHKDFMNLFPLPQNELDANPNLKQNPGY